jgi:hypothetical protein
MFDWQKELTERTYTNRVSVDDRSRVLLDGLEVPYEFLPILFKNFATSERLNSLHSVTQVILLPTGPTLEHISFTDGSYEYRLNDTLHCTNGPAVKGRGGYFSHYFHGRLHNADGPATEDGQYYLGGIKKDHVSFVRESPNTRNKWGLRGTHSYNVAKLGRDAVVDCLDGTVAVLEKSDNRPNIDDFILDAVGSRVSGYSVTKYAHSGPQFSTIYNYLRSDSAKWRVQIGTSFSIIWYEMEDGSRASMTFDHNSKFLSFYFKSPSGAEERSVTRLAFDTLSSVGLEDHLANTVVVRDSSGRLHNEHGPAIKLPSAGVQEYYLFGTKVSAEEFSRYDPIARSIVFKNADGEYHRDGDLPAIISFSTDPNVEPKLHWYTRGVEQAAKNEGTKLINFTGSTMPTYTEIAQQDRQNKFEEALKRVAKKATNAKQGVNLNGDEMDIKVVKHGEAPASPADTRVKQVTSGAKLGLQKAALRVGSQKAAEKLVETASPTDNVVVQRIVQLMLLLGTAEIVERLPSGAASKVGLTDERRDGFGGLARYVAGETLGRDAVGIAEYVAPMLLEKLSGISASDISELANETEDEAVQQEAVSTEHK